MSEQWIKETMELLEEWEQRKSDIEDKIGQLHTELSDLSTKITTGHDIIDEYMKKHKITSLSSKDVKAENLANKSYPDMLITIAQERQGYLRVADAVDILFKTNVGKDKLSIQNNIYSALNRMDKHFAKIAPGQYRYINHRQGKGDMKPSGVRQAVKELKEKNPQMTKREVLNYLLGSGFDFKGKKPVNAVNMSWANLGYAKEGKQQTFLSTT